MNAMSKTKDEKLLLRVFSLIKNSHFGDHKMSPEYLSRVRFDRHLGDQIADFVRNRFPEYYLTERQKYVCDESNEQAT